MSERQSEEAAWSEISSSLPRSLRPGLLDPQAHRLRAVARDRPGGLAYPFPGSDPV